MRKFLTLLAFMFLATIGYNISAAQVSFYIMDPDDNFPDWNQGTAVTVWNDTDFENARDNTANFFSFNYDKETELRIYDMDGENWSFVVTVHDGLDEIPIDEFNSSGAGTLREDEGTWYLTLQTAANGYEFHINVYKYGEAPNDEDKITEVTMGFNISGAGDEDAWKNLTIKYWDLNKGNSNDQNYYTIPVSSNSAQEIIPVEKNVLIIPAEGYIISNVVTYIPGIVSISKPTKLEDNWTVWVLPTPESDEVMINIEVEKAPIKVTFDFDGLLFGQNYVNVTSTYEDVNVETWEMTDNSLYLNPDGTTTLTLSTKDGYKLNGVTCTDEEGNDVPLANLSSEYGGSSVSIAGNTCTLVLYPAAAGLAFNFVLAESSSSSSDNSLSLNFSGNGLTNDAYTYVTVQANMQSLTVDSNNATYNFKSTELNELFFYPAEGYSVAVTCQTSDGVSYGTVSSESNNSVKLTLNGSDSDPIPAGLSVNVVVSLPPSKVTFYFLSSDDADIENQWEYVHIYNATADDTIDLDAAFYELEYSGTTKLFVSSNEVDTYSVDVQLMDYSIEQFNQSGKGTIENNDGTWSIELNPEADGEEITVVVSPKKASEIQDVTMNFNIAAANESGIQNPGDFVTIKHEYVDNGAVSENLEIDDNFASATGHPFSTFLVIPGEGYVVSNITTSSVGVASISEPATLTGAWTVSVAEYPEDEFASFFVYVDKAPATVTLAFTTESDFIYGNPQDFVTVDNDDINLDSTSNTVIIPETGLEFTLTPVEDYAIESLVITDGETEVTLAELLSGYDSSVTEEDGEWSFNLMPKAQGLVFTFDVEYTGALNSIELNFNATNFDGIAYEYVTVTANAITPIKVDSNEFTYEFIGETLDLWFVADEDYKIASVSCVDDDNVEFGEVTQLTNANGYQLSLPGVADAVIPEGLTVIVNVEALDNAVDSIFNDNENTVIYNLQGIRVYADELTPGMYIVNGKKVLVRK